MSLSSVSPLDAPFAASPPSAAPLSAPSLSASAAATPARARREHLFNPIVDFLCLGGGSILALGLIALVLPTTATPQVGAVMLLVAHVINHPHFGHSYQIFYRNYRQKAFGDAVPALRTRYLVAGLIVPVVLAAFFLFAVGTGNTRLLGIGVNLMGFFVGWHYVKQGFGMAMVDAALKRRFYQDRERKILLVNAYVCWIAGWLWVNRIAAESTWWGIQTFTIGVPTPLFYAAAAAAGVTTLLTALMFAVKMKSDKGLAWNGATAYVAAIYLWLLFAGINPLFIFVIPAFHSLQYLLVVWRFQLNVAHDSPDHDARPQGWLGHILPSRAAVRFTAFMLIGTALGALGFWGAPIFFDLFVPYDRTVYGPTLFIFICWIFINVHHYFLDNVMWRRENPDTKKYLFV